MPRKSQDRPIARVRNVVISQIDYGWSVAVMTKSKKTGKPYPSKTTYYPTLIQACIAAALLIPDESQAKTLNAYASTLRATVGELVTSLKALPKGTL